MPPLFHLLWRMGMVGWHIAAAGARHRLGVYASSCTYYFLISSVPVFILSGWFAAEMLEGSKVQQLLSTFPIYVQVLDFVDSMGAQISDVSFKAVGIFGVLYALWSASSLVRRLSSAFDVIFYAPGKKKRILIALGSYVLIPALMICAILLSVVGSVFAKLSFWLLSDMLGIFSGQTIGFLYSTTLPLAFVTLAAYCCYMVLSPAKPTKLAAFGAAAAFGLYFYLLEKLVLTMMKQMLSSYVIYGALGSLLLILLWAYLIFYGLFLMAEFASMAGKFHGLSKRLFYYVSLQKKAGFINNFLMLRLPFAGQEYLLKLATGEVLSFNSLRFVKVFSGEINFMLNDDAKAMTKGDGRSISASGEVKIAAISDAKLLLIEQNEMSRLIKDYPDIWDEI